MAEPSGINKEPLIQKHIVGDKHRYEIAKRVGDAWESLATFIGVSNVDVDDIKEKYVQPLERRLAMMRRWHELWGSEATYQRLVEGLRQIGRRDLIELLKEDTHGQPPSANPQHKNIKFDIYNVLCWLSGELLVKHKNACFIAFCALLLLGTYMFSESRFNTSNVHYNTFVTDQPYLTNNITHHSKKVVAFNNQRVRNCSSPESDLPIIHPLFVGRENDIYQVLLKVARAHIVNINGAPGFGKSTLAIHVGYEVVKNGTSVRYINVEEKLFSIVNQWQRSKEKAKSKFSSKNDDHRAKMTSLIKPSMSSLSNNNFYQMTSSKNGNLLEELQRWSEAMKCTNVLILDNCDDILMSKYRQQFLSLIDTLVMRSKFQLHIVIVSQERLLFSDDFDCWTVKELNQSASIEMLDNIAPAIGNEMLRTAAELVEGCPLALKVIGQLLHIHGAKLIPKLKKEVMTILDEASIPKQRFRIIMDIAFERLGILINKECGYVLSLFPGSFDEQAGTAIVQKKCMELYRKHSLLNEYSFAYNYRYQVHRLIKEYLQEKISLSENKTFIDKFRAYFRSLLLDHAMSQEKDESETKEYSLSFELHNLHYLKEILLTDMHLSSKELAVLGLLSDIDLIQLEELHRYYVLYIENVHEVCPLFHNLKLCGQMYSTIIRHLYQKCKCETVWAYLRNFIISPCMEYFQCKVARYLRDLNSSGVAHLSQDESSYINILLGLHCNKGMKKYRDHAAFGGISLSYIELLGIVIIMGVPVGLRRIFLSNSCTGSTFVTVLSLYIMCAFIPGFISIILLYDDNIMAITNTYHQFLRILEIMSKEFCHHVILLSAIMFITTFIPSRIPVVKNIIDYNIINELIIIPILTIVVVSISPSLPYYSYCCQFIPLCI